MIGRKNRLIAASIAAIVMLAGPILATPIEVAQAALMPEEEHWKYRVDRWVWDEDRRRTYGIINPQIIVQNETVERLEGYIADEDGTRLEFYDGDQVVNVRYMSNGTGIGSGWHVAGRVHDGYFSIDIPPLYRDADIVRIHIGTNSYTVDNGTPTTPQTEVSINSAILNYWTNSTLVQLTEVAEEPEEPRPLRSVYQGGSLIDWILSQNGLLPCMNC